MRHGRWPLSRARLFWQLASIFSPTLTVRRTIARQLIAGVLLVISALQILGGFRDRTAAATPICLVRGGSGATVGLIVLLEPVSDYLNVERSALDSRVGISLLRIPWTR